MNHSEIHTKLNVSDYDAIVSIGNKCPTAMVLRELKLYKESFPFDYIPTTPTLILKYLKNPVEYYPAKGEYRTADNVWFGHFDLMKQYDVTVETFHRRFHRLFKLLKERKRILFVYTSEADIYNEMNSRYNDNYARLKDLRNYLTDAYGHSDSDILAIHTNIQPEDENGFINYTITVEEKYLSDNGETNVPEVFNLYRKVLKMLFQKIFLEPK